MKRIEKLKELQDKETVINYESIVKRDKATLESIVSNKKLELLNCEESIDSFIGNPKIPLNEEFLQLIANKESIERQLELLDRVIKTYL